MNHRADTGNDRANMLTELSRYLRSSHGCLLSGSFSMRHAAAREWKRCSRANVLTELFRYLRSRHGCLPFGS